VKRLLLALVLLLGGASLASAQAPPPVLRAFGPGAGVRVAPRPGVPTRRFRLFERPGPATTSPPQGALVPGWAGQGTTSPASIGPAGAPPPPRSAFATPIQNPPGPRAFFGRPVDVDGMMRRGSLCAGGNCGPVGVATATHESARTGRQFTATRAICGVCGTRVGVTESDHGYRRAVIAPGGSKHYPGPQAQGAREVISGPRLGRSDANAAERAEVRSTQDAALSAREMLEAQRASAARPRTAH